MARPAQNTWFWELGRTHKHQYNIAHRHTDCVMLQNNQRLECLEFVHHEKDPNMLQDTVCHTDAHG